MPSDVIEPPVGSSTPRDERGEAPTADRADAGREAGLIPPGPPSVSPSRKDSVEGSTSGDELSAFLVEARPDPMLGAFVEPDASGAGSFDIPDLSSPGESTPGNTPLEETAFWPPATGALPPFVPQSGHRDPRAEFDPLTGIGLERLATDSPRPASSGDAFRALGLETSPGATRPLATGPDPASLPTDEGGEEEPLTSGVSWPVWILASYASAVTLGLIWVLISGRRLAEGPAPEPPAPLESRGDTGRRADRSHRLTARHAPPLDEKTTLGTTVRLGQLDVTPLSVDFAPVTLERSLIESEIKSGGTGALVLRLRIRNISKDRVLAPCDEAFLREREPGAPETYIETEAGHPSIDPFPLAVESEWSIVGQEFRDLKPGESFETMVVSAPDARTAVTPEMTWRILLRTDVNQTSTLGVRFRSDEIGKPL